MESSSGEIAIDFPGMIRVYKDGRVERLTGNEFVPTFTDPKTGVTSKDIIIIPEFNISARLFLPKLTTTNQKLPLLVYFYGGAFCISSPFTSNNHNYLTAIVAEANVIAVAVNYRRAPEHPVPTAYEDSWEAFEWIVSHSDNIGPEAWLNNHTDFSRVFLGGDGAGANIAHNMAIVAGHPDFSVSVEILGVALVHPYFWGSNPIGSEGLDPGKKAIVDKLWPFLCPSNPDNDDPRVNPLVEGGPGLSGLGCKRVLVCVAERDIYKDRGWAYFESLGRSGWIGVVEVMETEGEDNGFHLFDLESEKAQMLIRRLAAFYNRDMPLIF